MSKLSLPIIGKNLMDRWGVDEYEFWQMLKVEKQQIIDNFAKNQPDILGSYNTQIEVSRLIISEDVPNHLDLLFNVEFSSSFVERCEKKYSLVSHEKEMPKLDKNREHSVKDFIKNLRVQYENNNEIKIQETGKGPQAVTYQTMLFRNNQTKAWRAFIRILQVPPHTYSLGPAHQHVNGKRSRVKDYDRRLKRLSEIDRKLKFYLNQHFKARIPENYKLYEKCETEKSGTYKFKFQVVLDDTIKSNSKSKYENFPEDKLANMLSEMADENKKALDPIHSAAKMTEIAKILISKHKYTKSDIIELCGLEKEDIRYVEYENVEDLDQDS